MTGFFPIMMFALPAAALAIWHEPRSRARRRRSAASCSRPRCCSFLTGVTEPLEFAFMFVAFPLYVIHALLTGTSMALINALGIKDGFGFSAGFFDYVLNCGIATKPLLADPDRAGLRGRLLLPLPVRDPEVEPADPGPRGGRRGAGRRGRHQCLTADGLLLAAGRVVTPARTFAPGWVQRRRRPDRGGRAGARRRGPPTSTSPAATVVPGFVDTHVHGGGGASFDGGDPDAAARVGARPTAPTARPRCWRAWSPTPPTAWSPRRDGWPTLVDDGLLAGIHLEGPWLSPRHAGAHDPALLATPSAELVDRLVEAGGGHLRMVTLAPELPGGVDAVRRLAAAGVVAAIGHTDATYDQARAALDAGAAVGTHLFNAMRGAAPPRARPGRGAAGAPGRLRRADRRRRPRAPCDGRAWPRRPSRSHTVLVTDAMAAAAAADGDYRLGRLDVTVRDGVARLAGRGRSPARRRPWPSAVRFAVRRAGLSLEDAVRAATAPRPRCTAWPASAQLRPGYDADLVVLDDDLDVHRVMRRGRWVESPPR